MGCTQSVDIVENHNVPTSLPNALKQHIAEIQQQSLDKSNTNEDQLQSLDKSNTNDELSQSATKHSLKKSSPNLIVRAIRSFSVASNDSYRTSVYTGHYYDVTSGLTNLELINAINWVEKYKPDMKEFEVLKSDALTDYKERLKAQLSSYFLNINKKHDLIQNTNMEMNTTIPEDHFMMINTCLQVVKDNLDSSHVKEIAIVAIQLLRDDFRVLYDKLVSERIDINLLCAFVNDYHRLATLCGNLNEEIYTYESDDLTEEMFGFLFNEFPNDCNQIITKLLETIVQSILIDLNKVFFSKLFTPEWELSDIDAGILIATLKDYFRDILVWLNKEDGKKLVSLVATETLSHYIFGLENRPKKKFQNKALAIAKVGRDKTLMKAYFSKINPPANEFDMLDNISKLILLKK